jgi:hypothetical protein
MSGTPTTLHFRQTPVNGTIGAATQANPTGLMGRSYFYRIIESTYLASQWTVDGMIEGRTIGIVAYDYINARWSVLFTVDDSRLSARSIDISGWSNNIQAIKDFVASLPTPPTTDAAGDDLPYPASIAPF